MFIWSILIWPLFNPNQPGLFGRSIARRGVECVHQPFWAISSLFFYQKSTKHGLKWKLVSLSTYRAFEHHPKLHSFVVRWHRSSLLWPRKFSSFRYHNFRKFVIFDLFTWTICISNESWKHSKCKFDIKNTICFWKICKKLIFQKKISQFRWEFFFVTQIFRKFS